MQKLMRVCSLAFRHIENMEIRGTPRYMVYLFLLLIVLCIVLFMAAWVWKWQATGMPDLSIMDKFVNTLISAPFIAAIGFFGKALIDSDKDGVPDVFEKDEQRGERR